MMKNGENNGSEETGLVTPTPDQYEQNRLVPNHSEAQ